MSVNAFPAEKFDLANEGVSAGPLLPELGGPSTTAGTPSKEKGLPIGPETPRMFFKAWRQQGPASIDASSSVSSMKSPPGLIRNHSPNVILDTKQKFQYRTGGSGGILINCLWLILYL